MCPCRRASAGGLVGGTAARLSRPGRRSLACLPATRQQGYGFAHIRPGLVRTATASVGQGGPFIVVQDTKASSRAGVASSAVRLVTPSAVSSVLFPDLIGCGSNEWYVVLVSRGWASRRCRRRKPLGCLARTRVSRRLRRRWRAASIAQAWGSPRGFRRGGLLFPGIYGPGHPPVRAGIVAPCTPG